MSGRDFCVCSVPGKGLLNARSSDFDVDEYSRGLSIVWGRVFVLGALSMDVSISDAARPHA